MGATLTAIYVQGNVAWIAEVGDSRAYLIRAGKINQLTKDQSLVQKLLDSGAVSPGRMRRAQFLDLCTRIGHPHEQRSARSGPPLTTNLPGMTLAAVRKTG